MTKITLLMLVLLIVGVCGCTEPTGTPGRYQSMESPGDYLELRADGTYVVSQDDAFSGDYTTDQGIVKLIHVFGSFDLKQDGNTLTDSDGDCWVK